MENILKHADDKAVAIPAKITIQKISNDELDISIQNNITNKASLGASLKNVWTNAPINRSLNYQAKENPVITKLSKY